MISLPKDVLINDLLMKMPALDVIKFCQTRKEYAKLCQDENFWKDRLQKNFGLAHSFDRHPQTLDVALTSHHARIVPVDYNGKPFTFILVYPNDTLKNVFRRIYDLYVCLKRSIVTAIQFILIQADQKTYIYPAVYVNKSTFANRLNDFPKIDEKIYSQPAGNVNTFNIIDELDVMQDILQDDYGLSLMNVARRTPRPPPLPVGGLVHLPILYDIPINLDYDTMGNFIGGTFGTLLL